MKKKNIFLNNLKASLSEIQNNQRKDFLKNCKRMMFTKGCNIVLEKEVKD
jgi:hypothetical protein